MAIVFVERRIHVLNGDFFEAVLKNPDFSPSPFDGVTDDQYEAFLKEAFVLDFSKAGWYRPIQKRFADFTSKQLLATV